MAQETELTAATCPKEQKWCAYNHLPGGQITVIHFENNIRAKKIGDNVTNLLFTSKEQIDAFERSPQVAINIKGTITKNKVLVYDGPDLQYNKKAADVVIAWAIQKGLQPIETKNDKDPKGFDKAGRLERVEGDVSDLKKNVSDLNTKMDKILDAVQVKK